MDCRGRVLAASSKIHTVFAEPRAIKDPKSTSNELAPILDMGSHEICRKITGSENAGFVRIKTGVNVSQCDMAKKIQGIGIQSDWRRHYPMGRLASHVVGFTGFEDKGLDGIELWYDKELGGLAGQDTYLADALRRPIRLRQRDSILRDGAGIILTVDATIQQFARFELQKQYEGYEADSAIAIVAEPKTGAILAYVSLPDYDPNNIHTVSPDNLRNRIVADTFEPGSLLKPIVVAIALDRGVVTGDEKIFCEYGDYHGKGFGRIGEYEDHRFGALTVRSILVQSSNIGMAKIGQRLKRDKLCRGLEQFGFGRRTGFELPGEVSGLLRPSQKWTEYSVTRIPFGQEISVTAIQMLKAFCILANGGKSVQPYVVKAMVDSNGKITKMNQPTLSAEYIVKPEVAKWIVVEAMAGVVNEGTGRKAKLEKWQVFGKTGTANIAKSDQKGYDEDSYVASFLAGAPAEDPAVVVLVSIRKPNVRLGKGYSGGVVAAPVAAKILERTLIYLERYHQSVL